MKRTQLSTFTQYLNGNRHTPYNSWSVGLLFKVGIFGDEKRKSEYAAAQLRRQQLEFAQVALEQRDVLQCGPIELDARVHRVKVKGEVVDMSPTEFRLLEYLLAHQSRVVTRSELLRHVWNIDFDTDTSVVDTYISYLRKKLHGDSFSGIKTIRGIGFQIEAA